MWIPVQFFFFVILPIGCNVQGAVTLSIPPRQQWCYQSSCPHVGYCGETGFQSALLYYGNYVSQEIVRNSDGPCSASQKLTGECQLLVGVNDVTAANNLKLNYNTKTSSATDFLSWIQSSITLGYPAIAGFYAVWGTDPDYDHIMIIVGYDSTTVGTVSAIYWNDFSNQQTTRVDVANLFKTRSSCVDPVQAYCLPVNVNYGIRLEGNTDTNQETLRTMLTVSSWLEPDYSSEDQVTPKPAPIALTSTLTILGVVQSTRYAILRFDDYTNVPTSAFAKSSKIARQYCFTPSVSGRFDFVVPDILLSNQSYFFRTVINSTLCPTSPSTSPSRSPPTSPSRSPPTSPSTSPSRSSTASRSPFLTASISLSTTSTRSQTTATASPTPSRSVTSASPTSTLTATATASPTRSKSVTASPTSTLTATATASATRSKSVTASPTSTLTTTATASPTPSRSVTSASPSPVTGLKLTIPPRQQWCYQLSCPHVGYCGETGFQSALLYYGNYVSQEIVRNSDGPCSASHKLTGECQLLVGVNDVTAANNLKLNYNTKTSSATDFLSWIQSSITLGYPAIAGFYAVWGTDPDYDHIMIIVGYDSTTAGTVSAIYWNDFSNQQTTRVDVANLFKTRSSCVDPVQAYCLPVNVNYGIRLEGNTDTNQETLRTMLTVSSWLEPDYSSEDQVTPKPAPIALTSTLTILGVVQSTRYAILRFDDYTNVPTSAFAKSSKIARQYCFTPSVSGRFDFVVPDILLSNQSYFFRTVINSTCVGQ
eukprot:g68719.t1